MSILVGCCWTVLFHSIKRAYITMHLFPEEVTISPGSSEHVEVSTSSVIDNAFDPSKFFQPLEPNNGQANSGFSDNSFNSNNVNSNLTNSNSSSVQKTLKMVKVYEAPFFTAWILTICTVMFYPIHQVLKIEKKLRTEKEILLNENFISFTSSPFGFALVWDAKVQRV